MNWKFWQKTVTFETLCPEWNAKFAKDMLTAECAVDMSSYLSCAVGEAYNLRQLHKYQGADKDDPRITSKAYYNRFREQAFCNTCKEFAAQFSWAYLGYDCIKLNAYDLSRIVDRPIADKPRIESLKVKFAQHFQKEHM